MGVLEQITQMKNQGMSDSEIAESLRENGVSPRDVNNALSQSQIKSAVAGEYPEEENYAPSPQDNYTPQTQEVVGNYSPQEQTYQEYYPQEQTYETQSYSTTDSMMDIAGQVFSENAKTMQKQLDKFEQFKNLADMQLQNISERLKRIETMFDKLQIAVVEKVGSYGKELSSIKKEVEMVEDSFSKIANQKMENPSRKIESPEKFARKKKK